MNNLGRIAQILKCFDANNAPLSSAQIIERLDLTRSTGFGLIAALVETGWLERVSIGKLRLGPKARDGVLVSFEALKDQADNAVIGNPHAARVVAVDADAVSHWDASLTTIVDTGGFRRDPPYRIGFSNASLSNPWRKAMVQSVDYARKLHELEIGELVFADAADDVGRQLTQIDALAASSIDLLLISVASATDERLSRKLLELAEGGMPIVAVDRRPMDPGSLVAFVTASDEMIGRVSAKWVAEYLGGTGRVWMLSGVEGASPAVRRQRSALAAFSRFPDLAVESVRYTNWTETGGYQTIRNLLKVEDAPDAVWCDSGLQGVGSIQAFLDARLQPPPHTGGDLNKMYKLCLRERVPHAALDYPASMGARSLQVALSVLRGEPLPRRVEVPVNVILQRGSETSSVKADIWAELHVAWEMDDEAVLSQGPAVRSAVSVEVGEV